jgi:hypothetical protein
MFGFMLKLFFFSLLGTCDATTSIDEYLDKIRDIRALWDIFFQLLSNKETKQLMQPLESRRKVSPLNCFETFNQ